MAEGSKINFLPGKKKENDEGDETSGGRRFPAKRKSKAELRAENELKKVNGGIPLSEVAVPVEAPASEPVVEQVPVVEEAPAESGEAHSAPEIAQEPMEDVKTKGEIVGATIQEVFANAKLLKERKKNAKKPQKETVSSTTTEASALTPEDLNPEEQKLYAKLPKERRGSYLRHIAGLRRNEISEKENQKKRSTVKPRAAEIPSASTESAQFTVAPEETPFDSHSVPSVDESNVQAPQYGEGKVQVDTEAAPAAEPVPEVAPIAQALEGLEQEEVDRNIAAVHAGEVLSTTDNDSLPSVFHSNRRPKNGGEEGVPIDVEMNEAPRIIPRAEIETMLRELLGKGGVEFENEPTVPTLDSEDIPEYIKESLDAGETRAGWKSKLSELVGKFGEKVSERFTKSKDYLNERAKELDAKAKEYGANPEKLVRDIGEEYNKLSFKQKLLFGIGLGAGTAAFSGVSVFATGVCALGLGAQRIGGMASMYLKIEGFYRDVHQGQETNKAEKVVAATLAIAYTVGMGLAIGEAVKLASESSLGEAVHEWLKSHYPFGETGAAATGSGVSEAAPSPSPAPEPVQELPKSVRGFPAQDREMDSLMAGHGLQAETTRIDNVLATSEADSLKEVIPQPAVAESATATAAGEVVAPVAEMPSVAAAPGHGYEYMMKQLWSQLHENNVSLPEGATPDSDLARLINAKEEDIDALVHKIASDPKHAFVRPDGSSVRIDPGAQMTIGARGELHLSTEKYDYTFAPAHAPTTPVEVPSAPASLAEIPDAQPVETLVPEFPPLQEVTPPEQQPIHTIDVPEGAERPPESIDTEVQQPEAPSMSAPEAQSIVNSFNVEVSTIEPHIYENAKGMYAFGGDKMLDAQAQEYALKNHMSVFVDKSYKLFGFINVSKVIEYAPTDKGPLTVITHDGPSLVPDPNTFTKRVL